MDPGRKTPGAEACPDCFRPLAQCFCGKTRAFPTRLKVLILQHPQEKMKLWNSARLAHMILPGSILRTGLSWPNLRQASGSETAPGKWAALYLPGNRRLEKPFNLFNRKREPLADASFLEGIILLDGSWKQAHALWWRNPWLSRAHRIALRPESASRRHQAKPAGLSTIESIAQALRHLGEAPEVSEGLLRQYEEFIVRLNLGPT